MKMETHFKVENVFNTDLLLASDASVTKQAFFVDQPLCLAANVETISSNHFISARNAESKSISLLITIIIINCIIIYYCIVLSCVVFCCSVLCCVVLYCIVLLLLFITVITDLFCY